MNITKKIAAAALSAGLLFGGASVAVAETTPSRPPACRVAVKKLADLKALDARLKSDYAKLVRLRNAAERAGNDDAVERIDARLAKMRTARSKVVAQVKVALPKVKELCTQAPAADG